MVPQFRLDPWRVWGDREYRLGWVKVLRPVQQEATNEYVYLAAEEIAEHRFDPPLTLTPQPGENTWQFELPAPILDAIERAQDSSTAAELEESEQLQVLVERG